MARYVTTVRTPRSPEDAFAYVADLCNFAEGIPGSSPPSRSRAGALVPTLSMT